MYFIGQTRFSLYIPNSNVWNVSGFTEEEYIKHLFSDERMSIRAKIFAEISLPLMAKMKEDFDFRHIVSYSSILPEKWKVMLKNLQIEYPFLYLHEADTQKENVLEDILKGKPSGSIAYYRLDDDDLLSVNFLKALSKYNNLAFKNMAVSFGKGFAGYFKDGHFIDFRDCKQRFIAIGQAYIGSYIDGRVEIPSIHSHHTLDENYPVIVDSKEPMYIHTHHAHQDTNYRFSSNSSSTSVSIDNELLKFPKSKNFEGLNKAFPVLANDIYAFRDNKINISSFKNVPLNQKITTLTIKEHSEKLIFECDYKLLLNERLVSPKALVFSVSFDREVEVANLMFSPNKTIGWFKYLSANSGLSFGSLSFSLNKPAKIKEIKLIIWDERFTGGNIESLEIV